MVETVTGGQQGRQ